MKRFLRLRAKLRQSPRAGFTLVELSLAIAIFAFFLVVVIGGLLNMLRVFQQASTTRANQQTARQVIDDIRKEATFANSVELVHFPSIPKIKNIAQPYTPGVSPAGNFDDLVGLCVHRNAIGDVMYFAAEEYAASNYPVSSQQPAYALNQMSTFFGSGTNLGSGSKDHYFSTKHIYKADTCNPFQLNNEVSIAPKGLDDDAVKGHIQRIGSDLGSAAASGLVENTNVQFFRAIPVTTTHDFTSNSFDISVMVTQIGPPASTITGSTGTTSNATQFDNTVVMGTTVFPNVLP